jgi:hypothetical protein
VLRRVVQVQDTRGIDRGLRLKEAPQPPPAITEPDDLGGTPDALPQRFQPQTRLEGVNIAYDRHEPALHQPGHPLPCPLKRPAHTHHVAPGHAFTPQRRPTGWAGRPGGRLASSLSEHGFDQMHREDASDLPRRQDQCGEGGGLFHRTQQILHRRIIIAYAVVKA